MDEFQSADVCQVTHTHTHTHTHRGARDSGLLLIHTHAGFLRSLRLCVVRLLMKQFVFVTALTCLMCCDLTCSVDEAARRLPSCCRRRLRPLTHFLVVVVVVVGRHIISAGGGRRGRREGGGELTLFG